MSRALFPDTVITGELLERIRFDEMERYELVEGRLEPVSPTSPEHGLAMTRIGAVLMAYMPGWDILSGDVGVYTRRRPDTVRGVDVAAISRARRAESARGFLTVMPELMVEIISPSNTPTDLAQKVAEYVGHDALVWVVNLDARTVTWFGRCGSAMCVTGDTLILPNGSEVTVAALFA